MDYNKTKYKVAILLAGQARSYKLCLESIANFFNTPYTVDGKLEVEVDYFMHTWNTDVWLNRDIEKSMLNYVKHEPAYIEKPFIEETLKSLKALKVDQFHKVRPHRIWGGILYSSFIVNKLKSQYEDENDFYYDLVIRTRPDIVFYPNDKMIYDQNQIQHRNVYVTGRIQKMIQELYVNNLDDVLYMGDTATMNTASLLYQYAGAKLADPPIGKYMSPTTVIPERFLGPGTLMTKYLHQLNIGSSFLTNSHPYLVVRKSAVDRNLKYKDDFELLVELNKKFYSV